VLVGSGLQQADLGICSLARYMDIAAKSNVYLWYGGAGRI